jgi:protein FAM50
VVEPEDDAAYDPLSATKRKKDKIVSNIRNEELEGYNDDASLTKVVDRRWYEKNKHVFPASVWEDFDVTKDYSKGIRKDASGNSFFFS